MYLPALRVKICAAFAATPYISFCFALGAGAKILPLLLSSNIWWLLVMWLGLRVCGGLLPCVIGGKMKTKAHLRLAVTAQLQ